jgi:hypothetical protein
MKQTFRVRTPSGEEMHLRTETAEQAAHHMRPCFGFESDTLEVTDNEGKITFHSVAPAAMSQQPGGK